MNLGILLLIIIRILFFPVAVCAADNSSVKALCAQMGKAGLVRYDSYSRTIMKGRPDYTQVSVIFLKGLDFERTEEHANSPKGKLIGFMIRRPEGVFFYRTAKSIWTRASVKVPADCNWKNIPGYRLLHSQVVGSEVVDGKQCKVLTIAWEDTNSRQQNANSKRWIWEENGLSVKELDTVEFTKGDFNESRIENRNFAFGVFSENMFDVPSEVLHMSPGTEWHP